MSDIVASSRKLDCVSGIFEKNRPELWCGPLMLQLFRLLGRDCFWRGGFSNDLKNFVRHLRSYHALDFRFVRAFGANSHPDAQEILPDKIIFLSRIDEKDCRASDGIALQ
jgi:hypothetical protein